MPKPTARNAFLCRVTRKCQIRMSRPWSTRSIIFSNLQFSGQLAAARPDDGHYALTNEGWEANRVLAAKRRPPPPDHEPRHQTLDDGSELSHGRHLCCG